jgi:hypothetical protein
MNRPEGMDTPRLNGHIFQNPRLNADGLGFYYRDTYDGLGERSTDLGFRPAGRDYRRRARPLLGHARPKAWLDVGAGHLQIEVPDPECAFARLFGSRWFQWMQPQHLHMFPAANLEKALAEHGFTVVEVERDKADLGHDFVFATAVVLNAFGPVSTRPWAPGARSSPTTRSGTSSRGTGTPTGSSPGAADPPRPPSARAPGPARRTPAPSSRRSPGWSRGAPATRRSSRTGSRR